MTRDRTLLDTTDVSVGSDLPAGDFATWLSNMRRALMNDRDSDVPCGACTACCRSSQFIHITADEVDTLQHIPKALLFPAPGLPRGNVVLGYDERGHCPMLIDDRCSIYQHRPQTCRNYDCRIFPAAGITPAEPDKSLIAAQAQRWQFTYVSERDRALHSSVQAAGDFLQNHSDLFPHGLPSNTTQIAALAVNVHEVFFKSAAPTEEGGDDAAALSALARAVMATSRKFAATSRATTTTPAVKRLRKKRPKPTA